MPQPVTVPRHVFVYGTLRAGGSNDIARYVPRPERVGDGEIAGVLYDLGAYPGALLGGSSRLHGEVYRISSTVELELDALEGVEADGSGEYLKHEVQVVVDGEVLNCLAYEIQEHRVAGAPVIASGDWFVRG
ncbi:MAG: gamma-glutamylcyclotransferase [Comamonadaceae bacterium]|nr:MAG: gamma-glutamylcyclotransferase [Comamonadaceae bacterium]